MIKSNNIKNKYAKYFIVLLLLLTAFALVMLYVYKTYIVTYMHTPSSTVMCNCSKVDMMEDFKVGESIDELIISPQSEISGFGVKLQKYNTTGNGILSVNLVSNGDEEIYFSENVEMSTIKDNEFTFFKIPNILENMKNKELLIKIQILQKDEDVRLSSPMADDGNLRSIVYRNGEASSFDMSYQLMGGENTFIKPLFLLLFVAFSLFIILFWYLAFFKKIKLEKLFLVSIIVFGVFYMFIFPPRSIPDELIHIGSSYRYANVILGMGFGDSTFTLIRDSDFSNAVLRDVPTIDTYKYVLDNIFSLSSGTEMYSADIKYAGNWCQYIFTTMGVVLARLLNLGYVPMLYMGRLFNFAFFVVIMYFSVKRIPIGKMIICAVALMPVTMTLAVSFSYDTIMIALSIFFLSNAMHIAYGKEKVKWQDIALLCLTGGFLVAGKAGIYMFICLTALIIPIKRFKKKYMYFVSMGAVAFTCIIFMFIFNIYNIVGVSSSGAGTAMSSTGVEATTHTFSSIFTGKKAFIDIIINTLNKECEYIILTMVGQRLSWLNILMPFYIVMPVLLVLFFSAFKTDDEPLNTTPKTKLLFTAICLSVLIAFLVVAYTWTTLGEATIKGIQGRYFLPVLPLALFVMRSGNLTFKRNINNKLFYSLALINIMTLMMTFTAFVTKSTIPLN